MMISLQKRMKEELIGGSTTGTWAECHPSGWMQSEIFVRCVPKRLGEEHRQKCVPAAKMFLQLHQNGDHFLGQIVTEDQTWVLYANIDWLRRSGPLVGRLYILHRRYPNRGPYVPNCKRQHVAHKHLQTSTHPADVQLADHVLPQLHILDGLGKEDAPSLASCVWLANICAVLVQACKG
ncbi:hypothetical protein PR048_016507 [Dryococelus australis]|uniref:Uncharacterized protein n=1 Tax=Dryococelus australis TaxID=614101 RepID=A0ABQ9HKC7_9NEOP|nr:hypothetical protein PR048_016507 [Dryococelus australis]